MTRRDFLTRAILTAAVAPALAACGGPAPAKTIKVVIAEYSKDHTRPFWQALADQYSKQSGVKVDLQVVDWNSIDQQVSTMIQNNQPPDVLNLNAFASYAKDGLLTPATRCSRRRPARTSCRPSRGAGSTRGSSTASRSSRAPGPSSTTRTSSPAPGIAAPPRTWDELVQAAAKVQALGQGVIGYALPLGPEEAQAEWSIWMWNNGGDWKSGDRWTIDSAENVAALAFLADLANGRKLTQVNPGKTNRTDGAFQLFKDGKVGMVMGFSPLAAQARRRGQGALRRDPDADQRGQAGDPRRRGLPDGLQEEGQSGGGEGVPRPLLPAGAHHPLDRGGGLPARDGVGPREDGRQSEAQAVSRRAAERAARADHRPHLGPREARRPAEHRPGRPARRRPQAGPGAPPEERHAAGSAR